MSKDRQAQLSQLPQVDRLLRSPLLKSWDDKLTAPVRSRLAQELVDETREKILKGQECPSAEKLAELLSKAYEDIYRPALRHAINATGIVLHTNLGRAPLAKDCLEKMAGELYGYCTLEIEEGSSVRGQRTARVERYLRLLTGCEASLAVNNNAAAVFLVLHSLAAGKEVLLSRGEIVQIGGGFRLPDILAASGAKLVEVGTTNMTHLNDYKNRLNGDTAVILRVHQSCFTISGHAEEVSLDALKDLARQTDLPLVVDLGSGSLADRKDGELSVQRTLSAADVLCFSGDKLLGASQAGIIIGRKSLVERIRSSPLYRALRIGKLDLYLLEQTLQEHLSGRPTPTQKLLNLSLESLEKRARHFSQELSKKKVPSEVTKGTASIGGGTTPAEILESFLVEIPVKDTEKAANRLSLMSPAIFVRKAKDKIAVDLRTVFENEEASLVEGIGCLF